MPHEGFEPMIPAFEPAKTVHALGRAATVIGRVAEHANEISTSSVNATVSDN
jgi:hypothetical protein